MSRLIRRHFSCLYSPTGHQALGTAIPRSLIVLKVSTSLLAVIISTGTRGPYQHWDSRPIPDPSFDPHHPLDTIIECQWKVEITSLPNETGPSRCEFLGRSMTYVIARADGSCFKSEFSQVDLCDQEFVSKSRYSVETDRTPREYEGTTRPPTAIFWLKAFRSERSLVERSRQSCAAASLRCTPQKCRQQMIHPSYRNRTCREHCGIWQMDIAKDMRAHYDDGKRVETCIICLKISKQISLRSNSLP